MHTSLQRYSITLSFLLTCNIKVNRVSRLVKYGWVAPGDEAWKMRRGNKSLRFCMQLTRFLLLRRSHVRFLFVSPPLLQHRRYLLPLPQQRAQHFVHFHFKETPQSELSKTFSYTHTTSPAVAACWKVQASEVSCFEVRRVRTCGGKTKRLETPSSVCHCQLQRKEIEQFSLVCDATLHFIALHHIRKSATTFTVMSCEWKWGEIETRKIYSMWSLWLFLLRPPACACALMQCGALSVNIPRVSISICAISQLSSLQVCLPFTRSWDTTHRLLVTRNRI